MCTILKKSFATSDIKNHEVSRVIESPVVEGDARLNIMAPTMIFGHPCKKNIEVAGTENVYTILQRQVAW